MTVSKKIAQFSGIDEKTAREIVKGQREKLMQTLTA